MPIKTYIWVVLEAPKRNFDRRGEIGTGGIILVDQTYQKQKNGTFLEKSPIFGVCLPIQGGPRQWQLTISLA